MTLRAVIRRTRLLQKKEPRVGVQSGVEGAEIFPPPAADSSLFLSYLLKKCPVESQGQTRRPPWGSLWEITPPPAAVHLLARRGPEAPPADPSVFPSHEPGCSHFTGSQKGTAQTTTGTPDSCGLPEGKAGPLALLPCPFQHWVHHQGHRSSSLKKGPRSRAPCRLIYTRQPYGWALAPIKFLSE